jgi:hypothetical protein
LLRRREQRLDSTVIILPKEPDEGDSSVPSAFDPADQLCAHHVSIDREAASCD